MAHGLSSVFETGTNELSQKTTRVGRASTLRIIFTCSVVVVIATAWAEAELHKHSGSKLSERLQVRTGRGHI